ncbi:hypothetical protein ONZ51_g5307 [Trametes cubensis]|uniref:Ribosomal RNA methyltransferase FtsJ domain-containing protein n=1 Tax=Trametes cubensis TaxID=1111947 RepID=A0AAD7TVC6_9APHY|nr:hypothetical protein ONZ51_g5307 [Trametes cubensis]
MPGLLIQTPVTEQSTCAHQECGGDILKPSARTILERCDVQELRELERLRRLGWNEAALQSYYDERRRNADEHGRLAFETQRYYYNAVAQSMHELIAIAGVIPKSGIYDFLVINCLQGGHGSAILQSAPRAFGVGIDPPSEHAEGTFLLDKLDKKLSRRYMRIECDLGTDEHPLFPHIHNFDLVILGGNRLRVHLHPDEKETMLSIPDVLGSARLIGDFIAALAFVQAGGTIVARLSHLEEFPSTHLLYLLDAISDTIVVHKPAFRGSGATRPWFHVVAKGVAATDEHALLKERYLAGLRGLWADLRGEGTNASTARGLRFDDLDFVVSTTDILDPKGYLPRLVELGRGVWKTQAQAISDFLAKKGVRLGDV